MPVSSSVRHSPVVYVSYDISSLFKVFVCLHRKTISKQRDIGDVYVMHMSQKDILSFYHLEHTLRVLRMMFSTSHKSEVDHLIAS